MLDIIADIIYAESRNTVYTATKPPAAGSACSGSEQNKT
jgi:hypothetical protein